VNRGDCKGCLLKWPVVHAYHQFVRVPGIAHSACYTADKTSTWHMGHTLALHVQDERVAALVNGGQLNLLASSTITRLLVKLPSLTDEFVQGLLAVAAVARSDAERCPPGGAPVLGRHEEPGVTAYLEWGIREAQIAHVKRVVEHGNARVYK